MSKLLTLGIVQQATLSNQVDPYSSDAIPLTFTWNLTEDTEAGRTITLPLNSGNGSTFDFHIVWSDDTEQDVTTTTCSHTFDTIGEKECTITGTLEGWSFNNGGDKLKLTGIYGGNGHVWKYLIRAFKGCSNLITAKIGHWDTSLTTSVSELVRDCTNISYLDINSFTIRGSSPYMILNTYSLTTIDVSNCVIDTTTLSNLFQGCEAVQLLDFTNWDTTGVTNFYRMFWYCIDAVIDPSGFNVESATDLDGFMGGAKSLTTDIYDSTLISWAAQNVNSGLAVNFSGSKYTSGGAAEAARNYLINTKNWTITDGGAA